jgi:uncharacterized protein with GYD domain
MALFAVTGTYSAEALRTLTVIVLEQMEADLAAAATRLGGRLVKLLFVGGTYAFTAIFELPHGFGPGIMILTLLSSGLVNPGAEVIRLLTCSEIDQAVAKYSESRKST